MDLLKVLAPINANDDPVGTQVALAVLCAQLSLVRWLPADVTAAGGLHAVLAVVCDPPNDACLHLGCQVAAQLLDLQTWQSCDSLAQSVVIRLLASTNMRTAMVAAGGSHVLRLLGIDQA